LSYPITSLEELNQSFWRWLEEDYHRRVHSSLGMSPLDKYLSQVYQLRLVKDPDELNQLFMRREECRVNNDATFSLAGRLFEVSPALIGQRIEVRFDPDNLNEVLVFVDEELQGKALPVNLADNARVKRERAKPDAPSLSFHEAFKRREVR